MFWEQGCGKTVITLAAAEKLKELGKVNKVLIVCPSHITWQWEDKIKEFTDADVEVVTAKDKQSREYSAKGYQVTSYALFRKDYKTIFSRDWDLVIADEAQEIKNNRSRIAKLFRVLNREVNPEYRWALTGTAISNKLEELYSTLYWVDKEFLPKWPAFEKAHINRNYFGGIESYKNLDLLTQQLPRKVSRVTQEDMGENLPKIIEQTYYFDKTEELKQAELELLEALTNINLDLERDPRVSRAFHACRQQLATWDKFDFITKYAENHDKLVVFSFYKEPLALLKSNLEMNGISAVTFTGDENQEAKQQAIKSFKDDTEVLLCSNAGSTGLDIPYANQLIHIDVPFDFGTLDQRSKRITRLSSKFKTCVVSNLIIKYSLEEFYFKVVKNKELLAESVYTGKQNKVTIKPETLRKFLSDR